jgi:hypothetical protein
MKDKIIIYLGYIIAILFLLVIFYCLRNEIREGHLEYDPMLFTLKEVLKPVHPIIGKLQLYKGEKSYTINKERVFLCLYDENGKYYSLNTLIHVLLHEIAHILNTEDIGHTQNFHDRFEELLEKATSLGIYNPQIPIPNNYCEY